MDKSELSSKNSRLAYFDIAKGIGIILVIIAHIEYVDLGIRNYIVAFHMPLFFIVSGMLSCLIGEEKRDIFTVIKKKLKRIMLPYLIFSLLYPVIDFAYYFVTGNGDPMGSLYQNTMDTLVLYGNSVLWFLPTAFFGEVIFFLIIRGCRKISEKYAVYMTAVITLILALGIYYIFRFDQRHFFIALVRFFISAFFVSAGSFLYSVIGKMKIWPAVSAAAGVLLLLLLFFIHGINGTVDMHFGVYGNIFLYYINALVGSMGLVFLSMASERLSSALFFRGLVFYGKNSLFVMITHINFYILYCAEVLSFKITEYIPRAKSILFNMMTVLFVLAGEFVLIKVYEICKINTYRIIERNRENKR